MGVQAKRPLVYAATAHIVKTVAFYATKAIRSSVTSANIGEFAGKVELFPLAAAQSRQQFPIWQQRLWRRTIPVRIIDTALEHGKTLANRLHIIYTTSDCIFCSQLPVNCGLAG